MTTKGFAVFDADSHVVESPMLWENCLEPEYRALGKHALWRQKGRTGAYLKVNGEIFRDGGNPNLPRHALWRRGMSWDVIGELDPHTRHPMTEGASDPQARLNDMDAMGVGQAFLYPTWFAEGFFLVRDPGVANARLQRLGRRFLQGGSTAVVRRRDIAVAEHGLRVGLSAAGRADSVLLRRLYSADVCGKPLFEPHLLRAAVGRDRVARYHGGGARHTGLWNPEWTSHGPFF